MKNQLLVGSPNSARFAACPSTVKSGDLVLVGAQPACALNDYQANTGGATFISRARIRARCRPARRTAR